jgi:hypothetical protein
MIRGTPLKRVSNRRRAEMAIYSKERSFFLQLHPLCDACRVIDPTKQRASCDIHHKKGRTGPNYLDQATWMAVCRPCHDFIHSHPSVARKTGLLLK